MKSLCSTCTHVRVIISGTGSRFLLCRLSQLDKQYPKYPHQPVVTCNGFTEEKATRERFQLRVLLDTFAICRLDSKSMFPGWVNLDAENAQFLSITRTADELSIVCPVHHVPEQIPSNAGWRCLQVCGPLELSMVGVIANLANTLAAANISVFVLGTFDTDYILVKDADLERAIKSLVVAGHGVV